MTKSTIYSRITVEFSNTKKISRAKSAIFGYESESQVGTIHTTTLVDIFGKGGSTC